MSNVRTSRMDLSAAEDFEPIAEEKPDTVISLNVVEHIEDDLGTLKNYHDVLAPGGHAVILVPAHQWLFSECDRTLGHFRRYTRADLADRMKQAGFEVVQTSEFNRLGVLGWYVSGKMGRKDLSPGQMKLFNRLLPIARLVEKFDSLPGLSVIAIGRKPSRAPQTATLAGEDQADASSQLEAKPEPRGVAAY